MLFNTTIIIYVLIGVIAILTAWLIRTELRLGKMLRGKNAESLEDTILAIQKDLERYDHFNKQSSEYFKKIEARIKQSVQGVSTIRFNPFKGTGQGGGQSFSTAILNEKGNGVVLSSLYSRDRVSLFAKPLANFQSEFELTEEEQEAIVRAKMEAGM